MRVILAVAVALALFAPPAAADDNPWTTDACGDSALYGDVNGEKFSSPDPESPNFDIKSADVRTVREGEDGRIVGVDLTIQVCGEIVEPERWQHYGWFWVTPEGCRTTLSFSRNNNVHIPNGWDRDLSLRLSEQCDHEQQDLPLGTRVYTAYDVPLDISRVSVNGDTITLAVRTADLPAEAAHAVADGTTLITPRAQAQMLSGPGSVFVRDPQFGVTVSSGRDVANGPDFIVGQ